MRRQEVHLAPRLFFTGLAALVALACSPTESSPVDAGTGGTDAPRIDAPTFPGVETRTYTITRSAVPAGSENTRCLDIDSGLTEDMLLVGMRAHLSPGSHHLIVSLNPTGTPTPGGTLYACDPFRTGLENTIFIAQEAESGIVYPSGSGLHLPAGTVIGMEMHSINYLSDTPIDIVGTIELDLVPLPTEPFRPVHIAFTGNLSLNLPPHATTVETFDYVPPEGTEILAITSHTHALGVLATIELVSPSGSTLLHESTDWSHPGTDFFSPPVVVGFSDSVHLECTFDNTNDFTVYWGESFNAEMCFLWAYYLDPV